MRKVIEECTGITPPPVPENRKKAAYGKIELSEQALLLEQLDKISAPIHSDVPRAMEKYGIGYGYIAYQTVLNRDYENAVLSFESLGDRAQVLVGNKLQGIAYICLLYTSSCSSLAILFLTASFL